MKKKVIIGIIFALLAAAAAVYFIFFFKKGEGFGAFTKKSDKLVYVQSVRELTGQSLGNNNRYMGVVESQEAKAVQKDSSLKVKEIFVKEGDYVKEGDDLFCYDTTDLEFDLEQLNLDRTEIQTTIDGYYAELSDKENEKNSLTDESDILAKNSEITSTNNNINSEQFNLNSKDLEIRKKQEQIDNCVVKSPMTGIVKKINSSGADSSDDDDESFGPSMSSSSSADGFITIMAEGDYRIKGITDEMNIHTFTSGTDVILRSRVDESVIWKGSVAKVDMEPAKKNSDDDYYGGYGYSSGESASKYNFYVNPENTDGMILGQHLYIELDTGQGEKKEGLHLASYFIMQEESGYFVWKRNAEGKIAKTQITVGEYDEAMDTYEVTAGLSLDDFIAYPAEGVEEGCNTTTNYQEASETAPPESDYNFGDDEIDNSMTPGDADDMMFDDIIDDSEGPGMDDIDDTGADGPGAIIDDSTGGPAGDIDDGAISDTPDGSGISDTE